MSICYNIEEGLKDPLSYSYLFLFDYKERVLSSDIGKFKNLTKIIIDGGILEELPQEIGALSHLERLHLGGNRLTSVPESLENCSRLSLLYLDNNRFTSLPSWLGSLTALTQLLIGGNELHEIPPSWGKLTKLEIFSCRGNRISSLPPELSNWTSLEQLGIESNAFPELPEAVSSMRNLRYLSMAVNRITSIPQAVSQLTKLNYFWAYHNSFEFFPEVLLDLPELVQINLRANKIKDVNFNRLSGKPGIDLRGNPLSTQCRVRYETEEGRFKNIKIKRLTRGKKEALLFKTRCNIKGLIYKINRTLLDGKIITDPNLSPDTEFLSGLDLKPLSDKNKFLINSLCEKYFSFLGFLKQLGFTDTNSIYKTQSIDDWGKHLFTREQMNADFLIEKLKSSDPLLREQAVYALTEIDEPSRFALFSSLFPQENMILNSYLLTEMSGRRYEPAYKKICSIIENTEKTELITLCISYINHFAMDDTKRILLTLLHKYSDTSVKTGILIALLKHPGPDTASAVLPLLFASESASRLTAGYVFRQQEERAYPIFIDELEKRAAKLVDEEQTDWYILADIIVDFDGGEQILKFLNSKRDEIILMGLNLLQRARYSRGGKESLFDRALKQVQSMITGTNEKVDRAAEKTIRLIKR